MTVYIIQNQQKKDHQTGEMVPRFDLTSAEQYGVFDFLLPPDAKPFNTEEVIRELRQKLQNFCAWDYLLLLGNPILIGLSAIIASQYSNSVTFLQWSARDSEYIPVVAKIFQDGGCIE